MGHIHILGLISFKLWFHSRRMASAGTINPKSSIGPVAWIVVESGAINAAYLLTYTVVLQSGSHGLEVMACIVSVRYVVSLSFADS